MLRHMVGMAVLALMLASPPLWADYDTGRKAWDAGNHAQALAEWRMAANAGDRRAMLALGRLYARGLGAPQDYVLAHMWFNLAASRGETAAVKERYAMAAKLTPAERAEAHRRARVWRRERVGTAFRDCPGCPEMVVVPAGSFRMGSPRSEAGRYDFEGPVRQVTIAKPLAVGVKEVTRGEYRRFASATGHSPGDSCVTYEHGRVGNRRGRNWKNPGFPQTDGHPVVCVNWEDAKAYVKWLRDRTGKDYRLLSESEWEYVARGASRAARYWGESEEGQCSYANGSDVNTDTSWGTGCNDGYARTAPAGSYTGNGYGLYDVLGNVWEWVEDCWNWSHAGAPSDGRARLTGDCSRVVLRGGSWFDAQRVLRSANRGWISPGVRDSVFGFRVARTLTL